MIEVNVLGSTFLSLDLRKVGMTLKFETRVGCKNVILIRYGLRFYCGGFGWLIDPSKIMIKKLELD